jgi:hypothetical protein
LRTSRIESWNVDDILGDGGVDDPSAFPFREALGVLAGSLDGEARLAPEGRTAVRGALVGAVATSVRLAEMVRRHPEIAETPIPRPVFVTGLLRTGTTLVHNLLAQHPDLRVPDLWELMHPVGPRGDAADYERLADAAQAYVEDYYKVAPALPAIHFLDARRPDECHRLGATSFQSMVYEMRYRVPSYGRWLAEQDLTEAYRQHRRLLQAVLWRIPGGPVVQKCPFHLWNLPELMTVYPDARIIHLHRSPAASIPSTCSLCVTIRAGRSDNVDASEVGRHWLDRIERNAQALDPADRAIPDGQVLDVRYQDLVADPLTTLDRICDFIEVPLTDAAERAMRRYLADNGQARHGAHRYRPEDFGLDAADLERRFVGYRKQYDL